jgi:hypothetical protein
MSGIGAMAPPCQKTAREYDINRKCVRNWCGEIEVLSFYWMMEFEDIVLTKCNYVS